MPAISVAENTSSAVPPILHPQDLPQTLPPAKGCAGGEFHLVALLLERPSNWCFEEEQSPIWDEKRPTLSMVPARPTKAAGAIYENSLGVTQWLKINDAGVLITRIGRHSEASEEEHAA